CTRVIISSQGPRAPPALHSFPTRRSSDLDFVTSRPAGRRIKTRPTTPMRQRLPPVTSHGFGLIPFRSPLLRESRFLSFPPVTKRSEEHTSELQSRFDLVCRLLLEKKKIRPASSRSQWRQRTTPARCGPGRFIRGAYSRIPGRGSLSDRVPLRLPVDRNMAGSIPAH